MTKLHISSTLSLPLDAVTQKFGILGRTGSGKSYFATKLCEEMLDARAQIIALDPVGVWYGLRILADGKPGYSIPVFGGQHGDMPLEASGGALMADIVVDYNTSAVIDVSGFLLSEQRRFATDFATQLFHRKKSQRSALHLFVEEAQEFIPQQVRGDVAKMVGAYERLIKLGRNFGIGASLISQRPQSVNKDVLNQTECLAVFQMTGPQERKTIRSWIAEKGIDEDIESVLPHLKQGEAHFWSPQWLQISQTVHIAKKKTADVSSTPKLGVKPLSPKELSPVEIEGLKEKMRATIERAKADDPKELRKQIAQLRAELSKRPTDRTEVKEVKVPVLNEKDVTRLEKFADRMSAISEVAQSVLASVRSFRSPAVQPPRQLVRTTTTVVPVREYRPRAQSHSSNGTTDLGKCERAILNAVAQYPQGRSAVQIALLTGYSSNSGGFNNSLSKLRTDNFITRGQPIQITEEGKAALGEWEALPVGQELLQHWYNKVGKCERSILETLAANYPNALTTEQIAETAGYSANSGGFNNSLSRLRTLELINRGQPIKISDDLFG